MPPAAIKIETHTGTTIGAKVHRWLPVILFAVLWVDLVRQLSFTWESSEQYAYGWFVPFLALALFWRRWGTRPATGPRTTDHGIRGQKSEVRGQRSEVRGLVVHCLVVLLAVVLLPVRVVH